jgi:hypothetical protein
MHTAMETNPKLREGGSTWPVGRYRLETWWVPGGDDTHIWKIRDRFDGAKILAHGSAPSEHAARMAGEIWIGARFSRAP